MLAHDVRVVFDVRVDTQTGSRAGLCEHFGGGVDSASLGATDHPGEPVLLHFGTLIVRLKSAHFAAPPRSSVRRRLAAWSATARTPSPHRRGPPQSRFSSCRAS